MKPYPLQLDSRPRGSAALASAGLFVVLSGCGDELGPSTADTPPTLEVRLTADGLPLEGPQRVALRFFDDALASENIAEFRGLAEGEDGLFRILIDLDGSARPNYASLRELFAAHAQLWMTIEIDGAWVSQRLSVYLDGGVLRAHSVPEGESALSASLRFDVQGVAERRQEEIQSCQIGSTSDPAVFTDFNNLCTWVIDGCGTQVRIKWSSAGPACFRNAVANMPLVVILPGAGFDENDYDFLQNHLAQNGFLSVAINEVVTQFPTPAAFSTVASTVRDYIVSSSCFANFLDRFDTPNPVDFSRIGLIGHSRGGETIRFLADDLKSTPGYLVRAAVALAPTHFVPSELIDGTEAFGYMLLYGTADGDVSPDNAFAAHDELPFNDVSAPSMLDLERSMKLLVGGTHRGFSDTGNSLTSPANAQRSATQGYAHAFLRAWLMDDFRFYDEYIRRDGVPGTWTGGVQSQYSPELFRRVIDSFQHVPLSPSTLGGSVVTTGMALATTVNASTLAQTSHSGRVLRVQPALRGARVEWEVPPGKGNVSSYQYLSLRIGQMNGTGTSTVHLAFQNGSTVSTVNLADYGGITEPIDICVPDPVPPGGCPMANFERRGHMRTIRVPLDDFGSHDDARSVSLVFLGGTTHDDFIVDNLAFVDLF